MRGLTLPNRVVVSPMCQYNSDNGSANDWHLMHLGSFSLGCAGLVMCEMTNVNPQGRISPRCAGMWTDENEAALKRVHDFCRTYGVAKLGVQLAHAGRKGPTTPPAAGGKPILRGGRLDAGGTVGHSVRYRLAGTARHDQGRHQALPRRVRRRGQTCRPHRLRRHRAARRARLSCPSIPVAAFQ
jgi:2,4-dienoyl-CoA reductase-like NADH-dependent reductase (Old Yellow Enzyme family)